MHDYIMAAAWSSGKAVLNPASQPYMNMHGIPLTQQGMLAVPVLITNAYHFFKVKVRKVVKFLRVYTYRMVLKF